MYRTLFLCIAFGEPAMLGNYMSVEALHREEQNALVRVYKLGMVVLSPLVM